MKGGRTGSLANFALRSERIMIVNRSLVSSHYPVAEIDYCVVEKRKEFPTVSDSDFVHRPSENLVHPDPS